MDSPKKALRGAGGYDGRVVVDAGANATLAINAATSHRLFNERGGAEAALAAVEVTKSALALARSAEVANLDRAEELLRETERLLRHAQNLETIGALAGGIAHDFNNHLSVILSYGELLLEELKPDEPMRADVAEICKAGQDAAELARQVIVFSRQHVSELEVLDLNDVLTSVGKMLQRIIGADVALVSVPARPLGMVRVDRGSMEQVILNLVVNARDAMPTGGMLTMETANVRLDEDFVADHRGMRTGLHVMLAVTDTGIGMDRETQARTLDPIFTAKEKGTALGLATAFGLVQESGGSIGVHSEPGKGTTIKVYLPQVDASLDEFRSLPPATNLHGSETILLVENEEQVRAVARTILRKKGYHVIEARNVGEALMHSDQHPGAIDLLLTEVVMPQMSGPMLARKLAMRRPHMKVLCMSGYTDDSSVRHGVREARLACLQKPVTPESLTIKVREVLDTPRRSSE